MKYPLLLVLSLMLTSCVYGNVVAPPYIIGLEAAFRGASVSGPPPLESISIRVEEDGQFKTSYVFNNQGIDPTGFVRHQSSTGKRIRFIATSPNVTTTNIVEFVVDEYTGINSYRVQYRLREDSIVSDCVTPTKPCPVLP